MPTTAVLRRARRLAALLSTVALLLPALLFAHGGGAHRHNDRPPRPAPRPSGPPVPGGVELRSSPVVSPSGGATPRYYLANDDHSDYLWSGDADDYRAAFINMLDYYMTQAETTATHPPDFRGRFNCDGSIWVSEYEATHTAPQFQRLVGHLRDGTITMPLNTLVQLYGAMPAEAVLRSFYYAGRLERREDLRFSVVVPMENQTLPGGVASLWAGAGARYSWKGICACASRIDATNRPRDVYWFTGPDGKRVLMKWNSIFGDNQSIGGYAEARNPSAALDLMTSNPAYLARWPHDVHGAFGYGWDDLQSTTDIFLRTARDSSNASRRVIVSNETDFFADFETTHGGDLDAFGGSFGNEWELLMASMGEVTAKVKRSVEALRTAEALATVATLHDPGFMAGREAARDSMTMSCGLYFEHSWGAGPGVNEATRAAWQRQVQQALSRYVDTLLADALTRFGTLLRQPGGGFERHAVFNPLSFTRTDAVDLAPVTAAPFRVFDLTTNSEVPAQSVVVGGLPRTRILATAVPAVGYRVYEIRPGTPGTFPPATTNVLPTIENALYRVTLGTRGQITSVIDRKDADRQLVGSGGAWHDPGNGSGTVTLENTGPVSTTLLVNAGGTPAHQTRVTLYGGGIDRIDVEGRHTQNFGGTVTWTSRFNVTGGAWRHEEVGMIARAAYQSAGGDYADQNARTDYLTFNHFADLSDAARGITLSSRDSQFFQLGSSTPEFLDASSTTIRAVVGMQVDGAGLGIANQAGDTQFLNRFGFRSHGVWDPAAAMRFALEHQNPLVATRVTGNAAAPLAEANATFLDTGSPDILLWALKPAEEAGQGFIARVWNLADQSRALALTLPGRTLGGAQVTTHVETPLRWASVSGNSVSAALARQEMSTFRLFLAPVSAVAPPAEGVALPLSVAPNPGTRAELRRIRFTLARPGPVTVRVFDTRGALRATLLAEPRPAGPQIVEWTPRHWAPGVYFVRVETPGGTGAERIVIR